MKNLISTTSCLSQEQIRKYLSKDLSEEERFEVENHMLDCPLCDSAVEGFSEHYSFEDDVHLAQIEAELLSRGEEEPPENIRQIRSPWLNRIAAGLLFLLVSSAGFFYWNANKSQRLYQSYYAPMDNSLFAGLRSGEETAAAPSSFDKALSFYNDNNFLESIPHFEAYLNEHPENATANFLAGLAYLETNQNGKASTQLEIARINSAQFYEEATWYLALTKVKMEELDQAKLLLSEIVEGTSNLYKEKAKALLAQISN